MKNENDYLQDWQKVSDETSLQQIEKNGWFESTHAKGSLYLKPLNFYSGYSLYKLKAHYPHGDEKKFFIGNTETGDFQSLDWTRIEVSSFNNSCPIQLNKTNVIDYLHFFSDCTMGVDGPYTVVENLEHSRFKDDTSLKISEEEKQNISDLLIPPIVKKNKDQFEITASVWWGKILYHTTFGIKGNGDIEVRDAEEKYDFPFVGNIPWYTKKNADNSIQDGSKIQEGTPEENVDMSTKEGLINHVKNNLPLLEILEEGNYIIDKIDDFIWFTPLQKKEKELIEKELTKIDNKIEETHTHYCLTVLALKGHQLRQFTITVCKTEDSQPNNDKNVYLQPGKEKKGNIAISEDSIVILLDGLPDNWCYREKPFSTDGYNWIAENPHLKYAIVQELNRTFVPLIDVSNVRSIRKTELPFYQHSILYEIGYIKSDETKQQQIFYTYLIYRDNQFISFGIDWSSAPIHKMNENLPLVLDADNIADYLCFFCDFVIGDKGPFTIIESRNHSRFQNVDLSKTDYPENLTFEEKQLIWHNIKPLKRHIINDEIDHEKAVSHYRANVHVWYEDHIFLAAFKISTDGMVEMEEDGEPLLELDSFGNTPWHKAKARLGQFRPVLAPKQLSNFFSAKNSIFEEDLVDKCFIGSIHLEGSIVEKRIAIKNCRFRGAVDFSSLHCKGLLKIENCIFENTFTLTNAQLDGGLVLKNVTILSGRLNSNQSFLMPRVSARLIEFKNVCCQGITDFSDLNVMSELTAINLFSTGSVTFERSRISGSMRLSTAEEKGNNLQFSVSEQLNLKDIECRHLTLEGLCISGSLDLSDASLEGGLIMKRNNEFGFYIAGFVSLSNMQSRYLSVLGINIGGGFSVHTATIEEYISINSFRIGTFQHIPTRIGYWADYYPESTAETLDFSLYGTTIKHSYLSLSGVDIAGDLILNFAKIGTGFFFRSTSLDPLVNHIGGSLTLDSLEVQGSFNIEGVQVDQKLTGQMVSANTLKIFPALVKVPKTDGSGKILEPELQIRLTEIKEGIDLPQFQIQKGEISGLKILGKTVNNVSLNLEQLSVEGSLIFFNNWKKIKDRLSETFQSESNHSPDLLQKEKINIDVFLDNLEGVHEDYCRIDTRYGINLKNASITYDLDLSCIQCNEGNINIENAVIGGDVHIIEKHHGYKKSCALEFHANSAHVGDDMDLTGLVLKKTLAPAESNISSLTLYGSIIAPKLTVLGTLSFYKSDLDKPRYTVIPGKLDLESAKKIGLLEISEDSFSSNNNEEAIILKQSSIERLVVWNESSESFPQPVELDFMEVKYWEFKDKSQPALEQSNKAENYISFLKNSRHFQRHTYRSVENTLLNQGLEEEADKIHAAMYQQVIEEDFKNIWMIPCGIFRRVWGWTTTYGTQASKLIALVIFWFIYSVFVFSNPENISPSELALAGTNTKLLATSHPNNIDWSNIDGLNLALRYHVPIITLDARDEWEASDNKQLIFPLSKLLFTSKFTPEDYASLVTIVHWILWPFIVFVVSRRILRRRGSG